MFGYLAIVLICTLAMTDFQSLMTELEDRLRNIITEQHIVAMFGLGRILLTFSLSMMDFQDNSGGPLICNGEVIGLQSYVDNDDCKPPYFYQMFWAWSQFITCGTNDCEGKCDAICTSKYKDEINDNYQTITISNISSEKTPNENSFDDFAGVIKKTALTYENNSQNIVEESSEKKIIHKKENHSHEKELEIPGNQKNEQEYKTKTEENTITEGNHISTNSQHFSSIEVNLTESEDEVTPHTNQDIKNNIIEEDHHISPTNSHEPLEKKIKFDTNDDEQKEYSHLIASKDQLKEDLRKTGGYQNVSEEDSSANDNIYTRQHKVTSEDNDDITEEKSSSEEDKKEKVTEEGNNISEINNNAEVNKEKNEDNTSEDASNKPDQDQNFTETGEIKSRNQIEITNESNEDSVLVETKIEDGNEKMSTISELDVPENDKETSSEKNEDNALVEANQYPKSEKGTTQNGNQILHSEQKHLEGENNLHSMKGIKTTSESQNDSIGKESIVLVYEKDSLKDEKENGQNKTNSEEESSSSRSDNEYKDDNHKEKVTPENNDQAESKRISHREKNISQQTTETENHTKGATPTTSEEFKSSKREEYLNHSTEPNESHSSHIIMEVTSVVIKTVEDLLYAHRNTSRHYAPRTTVDLNDTEILLTPKPKFGKMGRTMADHAGGRTQHTILHCLFIGRIKSTPLRDWNHIASTGWISRVEVK
ncbi:hypothetical protein EVAR_2473_1 [Eumeta japonica]|uniref:Uncharacterized protein n=1 Tax=Eumeta variegata TaxID=151549 RepID=A0A4C1SR97_EUMVA|nr:hypothetical protein EVAR_2473_1 [Eumeta japonica]